MIETDGSNEINLGRVVYPPMMKPSRWMPVESSLNSYLVVIVGMNFNKVKMGIHMDLHFFSVNPNPSSKIC